MQWHNTISDLLMLPVSRSRSPVFCVRLVRSDPARSTSENYGSK